MQTPPSGDSAHSKYFPKNVHKQYHAHVYFDQKTSDFAASFRERISDELGLPVGRFHEKNVGPHTRWSYQVLFDHRDFDRAITWLDSHRNGLTLLVHGVTGDDYADHTDHAYWLGEPAEINLAAFDH